MAKTTKVSVCTLSCRPVVLRMYWLKPAPRETFVVWLTWIPVRIAPSALHVKRTIPQEEFYHSRFEGNLSSPFCAEMCHKTRIWRSAQSETRTVLRMIKLCSPKRSCNRSLPAPPRDVTCVIAPTRNLGYHKYVDRIKTIQLHSTINFQLSTFNFQLSTFNFQLSTFNL